MKKASLLLIIFISIVFKDVFCQDAETKINQLGLQLKAGSTTISDILGSDSLMYLHSLTPFREMIKSNAKPGKISIVTQQEPGTRILVKGTILNKNGALMKNMLMYFYHTSDKGWYADTGVHIRMNEGDHKHARLFGYLKTDEHGAFIIETIKPKGYPKSDLAAHIHIQLWGENNQHVHATGELQFEDDPRMTAERKKQSLEEGFLISSNSGTAEHPVYEYKIIVE